ncbi:uncharacterized protein LOC129595989 isoform X2 [Paramacrobiotus metropolitanus]|uniref:uncharacterized protein LOC129595989 isoform X2 n=1 Tax=Paramacrobiotus metropolitanus TaxID=2943436 RepID=UPI0024461871|nr:uncharacterized protein LOC129595989 isoform X2 [Paramacrobiotus metropolitanus]
MDYSKPGITDFVATGTANGVVPVARLVSPCVDLETSSTLSDAYWNGASQMEGNKVVVKLFHANHSLQFHGILISRTSVALPPVQAVRIVIEHPFPTGFVRLPRITLRKESVVAKLSDLCPEFPMPPLITEQPHILSVSCTFDRNLCGWTNSDSQQKFFVYPGYGDVVAFQGAGAAAALMISADSEPRFGPLVSRTIMGSGRTQLFFTYRMDYHVQWASIIVRPHDGSKPLLAWYTSVLDELHHVNVWQTVRASYCFVGNYTLELTAHFAKYEDDITGFWVDNLTLQPEEIAVNLIPDLCSTSAFSKPLISITCDNSMITTSISRKFCGWQVDSDGNALAAIEPLAYGFYFHAYEYNALALCYRVISNTHPNAVSFDLVSPEFHVRPNDVLHLWYSVRRRPAFIRIMATSAEESLTLYEATHDDAQDNNQQGFKKVISLGSLTGPTKITIRVRSLPPESNSTAARPGNSNPDFAVRHIWFPQEEGYKPEVQIDRLPKYETCKDTSYQNVSCTFEKSDSCVWFRNINHTAWLATDQPYGTFPFVFPDQDLRKMNRRLIYTGSQHSIGTLESSYIGPVQTRFSFKVYMFGAGLRYLSLHAESMSTYYLLWNSTENTTTRPSARQWQTVNLELCIKFPFKLVFKISTSKAPYIAALDDIQLDNECTTLKHDVDCKNLKPFSPPQSILTSAITKPAFFALTAPAPAGTLHCMFHELDFCGWYGIDNESLAWSIVPSGNKNETAAAVFCSRLPGLLTTATAYLISPKATCSQWAFCFFEFEYRSSQGSVVEVQLWMASNKTSSAHLAWGSGPNEFPLYTRVTVNLSSAPGTFWLVLSTTFFEDASNVQVRNFNFFGDNGNGTAKSDYGFITLSGNILGGLSILTIIAGLLLFRYYRAQRDYCKRLYNCEVHPFLFEELEIPSSSITLLNKELRRSHFCQVGLARITKLHTKHFVLENTTVVVKFLLDKCSQEEERYFLAEMAAFMMVGRHKNIVSLIGVILKGRPMIVMEHCANGSLLEHLQKKNNYVGLKMVGSVHTIQKTDLHNVSSRDELQSLLSIVYQVAAGMEFLCSRGFLHRDLAARNVLLDSSLTAKIGDFGLARNDSEYILQRQNVLLPLGWMAPEALVPMEGRYCEKSDIWSFAVLLWECFTFGRSPYEQQFPQGLQLDVLLEFLARGERLVLPGVCPHWMNTLVSSCWEFNPADRPTFSEILKKINQTWIVYL